MFSPVGYLYNQDSKSFHSGVCSSGRYYDIPVGSASGQKGGAAAAGLGSALADLLGGYAAYAPWTFLIKALMAFIMGAFIEAATKKKKHHVKIGSVPLVEIVGMVLAGIEMVIGYAAVDGILAGNLWSGILGAPFNIGQFTVGLVLATILAMALYKTPAKKLFAYRLDEIQ